MSGQNGPPFPQRNYGGPGGSRQFFNRQITFNGPSQARAQQSPPTIGPPLYVNYQPPNVRPPPFQPQPQFARPPPSAAQPFHAPAPVRSGELHWVPLIDFIVWYLGENPDVARAHFADFPSIRDEIFEKLQWPQRLRSVMENSVAELSTPRRFARGPDDRFQLVACFRGGPDRPTFFPLQQLRVGLDYPLNKLTFEGRRPFRRHRRNQPGQEAEVQTDSCDTSSRSVQTDCDESLSDLDEDQCGLSYDADVDTAEDDRSSGGRQSPPADAENERELSPASAELNGGTSPAPAEGNDDSLSEASEALQHSAEIRPRSRSADATVHLAKLPRRDGEMFEIAARGRKPADVPHSSSAQPRRRKPIRLVHPMPPSNGEDRADDDRSDTLSPEL